MQSTVGVSHYQFVHQFHKVSGGVGEMYLYAFQQSQVPTINEDISVGHYKYVSTACLSELYLFSDSNCVECLETIQVQKRYLIGLVHHTNCRIMVIHKYIVYLTTVKVFVLANTLLNSPNL